MCMKWNRCLHQCLGLWFSHFYPPFLPSFFLFFFCFYISDSPPKSCSFKTWRRLLAKAQNAPSTSSPATALWWAADVSCGADTPRAVILQWGIVSLWGAMKTPQVHRPRDSFKGINADNFIFHMYTFLKFLAETVPLKQVIFAPIPAWTPLCSSKEKPSTHLSLILWR